MKSTLRALVVYLGVSWLVMQFVDTLTSLLSLPDWLGPATVGVLAAGLPVVLATAWVQSLAATTAAEEAGEVPTDWEVAPSEALAEIMAGHLPHLTWGRAIAGGVVALSLTIGAAGGYVLLGDANGPRTPAPPGEFGRAVAVLPFAVSGGAGDLDHLEEGMVVLLSENLDGVGDLRAVNHRTVMARWDEELAGRERLDLPAQLRVASSAGARFALSGSIVSAGENARFTVDIHDLAAPGDGVDRAERLGNPGDIFALVDGLSVDVVRALLGAEEAQSVDARSLSSITTHSVDALNAYLRGVTALRDNRISEAAGHLDRAVAIDSTFAVAWLRLGEAIEWFGQSVHTRQETEARVAAHSDQLAPRERVIAEARALFHQNDPRIEPLLRNHLRRHPQDGQAWFMLGDAWYHWLHPSSADSILHAFRQAVDLDPAHLPHWGHLFDTEVAFDHPDRARAIRDALLARAPDSGIARRVESGYALHFGSESERADAIRAASASGRLLDPRVHGDGVARQLNLTRQIVESSPHRHFLLTGALVEAGRPQELLQHLESSGPPAWEHIGELLAIEKSWGIDLGVRELLDRGIADCPLGALCRPIHQGWVLSHAIARRQPAEVTQAVIELRDALAALRADSAVPAAARSQTSEMLQRELDRAEPVPGPHLDRRPAARDSASMVRDAISMADAAIAAGDLDTAESYLRSMSWRTGYRTEATWKLARMLESSGREEEALAEYRRLSAMWTQAEEDFAPAQEVRAAIARLGG